MKDLWRKNCNLFFLFSLFCKSFSYGRLPIVIWDLPGLHLHLDIEEIWESIADTFFRDSSLMQWVCILNWVWFQSFPLNFWTANIQKNLFKLVYSILAYQSFRIWVWPKRGKDTPMMYRYMCYSNQLFSIAVKRWRCERCQKIRNRKIRWFHLFWFDLNLRRNWFIELSSELAALILRRGGKIS